MEHLSHISGNQFEDWLRCWCPSSVVPALRENPSPQVASQLLGILEVENSLIHYLKWLGRQMDNEMLPQCPYFENYAEAIRAGSFYLTGSEFQLTANTVLLIENGALSEQERTFRIVYVQPDSTFSQTMDPTTTFTMNEGTVRYQPGDLVECINVEPVSTMMTPVSPSSDILDQSRANFASVYHNEFDDMAHYPSGPSQEFGNYDINQEIVVPPANSDGRFPCSYPGCTNSNGYKTAKTYTTHMRKHFQAARIAAALPTPPTTPSSLGQDSTDGTVPEGGVPAKLKIVVPPHIRTKNRMFQCPDCYSRPVKSINSYRRHWHSKHSGKQVPCCHCPLRANGTMHHFTRGDAFQKHFKRAHSQTYKSDPGARGVLGKLRRGKNGKGAIWDGCDEPAGGYFEGRDKFGNLPDKGRKRYRNACKTKGPPAKKLACEKPVEDNVSSTIEPECSENCDSDDDAVSDDEAVQESTPSTRKKVTPRSRKPKQPSRKRTRQLNNKDHLPISKKLKTSSGESSSSGAIAVTSDDDENCSNQEVHQQIKIRKTLKLKSKKSGQSSSKEIQEPNGNDCSSVSNNMQQTSSGLEPIEQYLKDVKDYEFLNSLANTQTSDPTVQMLVNTMHAPEISPHGLPAAFMEEEFSINIENIFQNFTPEELVNQLNTTGQPSIYYNYPEQPFQGDVQYQQSQYNQTLDVGAENTQATNTEIVTQTVDANSGLFNQPGDVANEDHLNQWDHESLNTGSEGANTYELGDGNIESAIHSTAGLVGDQTAVNENIPYVAQDYINQPDLNNVWASTSSHSNMLDETTTSYVQALTHYQASSTVHTSNRNRNTDLNNFTVPYQPAPLIDSDQINNTSRAAYHPAPQPTNTWHHGSAYQISAPRRAQGDDQRQLAGEVNSTGEIYGHAISAEELHGGSFYRNTPCPSPAASAQRVGNDIRYNPQFLSDADEAQARKYSGNSSAGSYSSGNYNF